MIYTLTLNPALDYDMYLEEELKPEPQKLEFIPEPEPEPVKEEPIPEPEPVKEELKPEKF